LAKDFGKIKAGSSCLKGQLSYLYTRKISIIPVVHLINSIKILLYFDDHIPPHFHAQYNEYEVLIEIATLEVYGSSPNRMGAPFEK